MDLDMDLDTTNMMDLDNQNDGFGRFTEIFSCIDGIAWRFGHSTYPLARKSARKFVQDPGGGGCLVLRVILRRDKLPGYLYRDTWYLVTGFRAVLSSHLTVFSAPATSVHPESVLIPRPEEILLLWSQTTICQYSVCG